MNRDRRGASVYVADDHPEVLNGLVELIDSAEGFSVVGSSTKASIAVAEIVALRPAVAVIDGHIADDDGLRVYRQVHALAPEVACVILTTGVTSEWGPAEAAEAGVAAVVLKQLTEFPLLEVLADVTKS